MGRAFLLAAVLTAWALPANARQSDATDSEELLLMRTMQRIEMALVASDRDAWLSLVSVNADAAAAGDFFDAAVPRGVTRAVVHERDRQPLDGALPGDGYQLIVEVFVEAGARGQLSTWRLDVRRPAGATAEATGLDSPWRIAAHDRLSHLDVLHRLELDRERMFQARDFLLTSVDFELRLLNGAVFVADTEEGITALVLLGDGLMTFQPTPKTERGQVRLFAGDDKVESRFEAAFVRLNPFDFEQALAAGTLTSAPADGRLIAKAREIFDQEVARSFSLDLSDMSRDTWSILPQSGDVLAEVRTRRWRTLTYVRSSAEAEDVTFFTRERQKNIAIYASPEKLASRGVFYNEDDLAEFDILDHEIDIEVFPDRQWISGTSRLKLRVKAFMVAALNLKLADNLTVSSVSSRDLGHLLFLKVRNQNSIVINLPTALPRDYELTLTIRYQGLLDRQTIDAESVQSSRAPSRDAEIPTVLAEPNWLLSNRAMWYPQSTVTDFATATLRVVVPTEYLVAATGVAERSEPEALPAVSGMPDRHLLTFRTGHPVRYLGVVISRMKQVDAATVALDIVVPPAPPPRKSVTMAELLAPPKPPPVGGRNTVDLVVMGNRRQEGRARDALDTAADILRFYAGFMGDAPYPSFTLAMLESDLPGGHSPAYFAVINNPLPTTPLVWRNDPAAFNDFPEFFLAHEIAHQWWGQAVGWKNYHEQWISEGFSQYFATLYARERHGDNVYRSALRNLRRWSMEHSDQGPISLGYRLGHVKGESRVFRALVYNKGAAVLNMLRRLVGDEAFQQGLKAFYADHRYEKAGTDDLRLAMEQASGRPLERYFERWVLDSSLPHVRLTTTITADAVEIGYQQYGEIFDVPVTITLRYADGSSEDAVVAFTEASGTAVVPTRGRVRGIDVNKDDAALGTFDRR